jgi:hypothetical protein
MILGIFPVPLTKASQLVSFGLSRAKKTPWSHIVLEDGALDEIKIHLLGMVD